MFLDASLHLGYQRGALGAGRRIAAGAGERADQPHRFHLQGSHVVGYREIADQFRLDGIGRLGRVGNVGVDVAPIEPGAATCQSKDRAAEARAGEPQRRGAGSCRGFAGPQQRKDATRWGKAI